MAESLKMKKTAFRPRPTNQKTTKAEFRPRPKLHYLFIEQNCLDIVLICFLRNAFKKLGAGCVVMIRPALIFYLLYFSFTGKKRKLFCHWKKPKVYFVWLSEFCSIWYTLAWGYKTRKGLWQRLNCIPPPKSMHTVISPYSSGFIFV